MSRFGLRKKMKRMLDRNTGPKIIAHEIVYLLPDGTEQVVQAEERYTILMASQALPAPISTGRRAGGTCPDARCGLCRVEVMDDAGISPMNEFEQQVLADHTAGKPHDGRPREAAPEPGPNTRLGCHARIVGPGGRVKVAALVDYEALRGEESGT